MPQLRLTQKFASDLKVAELSYPKEITTLLDDWVIDRIRISRKKVAIITHVASLYTFLIPYFHVGGAASIPGCIEPLLIKFINDVDMPEFEQQIDTLFAQDPVFCKTLDRCILGYMNQFKYMVEVFTYDLPFEAIDWDSLIEKINDIPCRLSSGRCVQPAKHLVHWLKEERSRE